jgi:hypothetical protein
MRSLKWSYERAYSTEGIPEILRAIKLMQCIVLLRRILLKKVNLLMLLGKLVQPDFKIIKFLMNTFSKMKV